MKIKQNKPAFKMKRSPNKWLGGATFDLNKGSKKIKAAIKNMLFSNTGFK